MSTGDVPYPALPPSPADRLLKKARTRFPDLTPAEEKMVRAAAEGELAEIGTAPFIKLLHSWLKFPAWFRLGNSQTFRAVIALMWKIDFSRLTIRAAVLRWLCTNPAAVKLIHAQGVQIYGAVISGQLDFQQAHIPVPLLLAKCEVREPISAIGSHFASLGLNGCVATGLSADGARFDGWLNLRYGTRMAGEVRLLGATIGANLDCSGACFDNTSGDALNANGLRVRGSVFLRDGFHATGEVNLLGATIGGNFSCTGGRIENPDRIALVADGLRVRGSVFLRDGFHATGEVRLPGAIIGVDFACNGGRFDNAEAEAIVAQSVRVAGNLFLIRGFQVQGDVSLFLATIGGGLDMHGWHCDDVHNPHQDDTFIHGTLDLSHCRIGTLADGKGTIDSLKNTKTTLLLHGFTYSTLAQDAPTDAETRLVWLRLHPEEHFTPQPYGQLARVLDALGHAEDAREIRVFAAEDAANHQLAQSLAKTTTSPIPAKRLSWIVPILTIAFLAAAWAFLSNPATALIVSMAVLLLSLDAHYRSRRLMATTRWLGQWALGRILGHGYHPLRPLWGMIAFLLLGWLIFFLGQAHMRPSSDQVLTSTEYLDDGSIPPEYPRLQPLVYSADLLLPIIDLDQANLWRPDPGPLRCSSGWFTVPTTGECLRAYAWIHVLAGWTFSTFLIIGLTGLVKKELPEADSPNT
jgi:hypothetical protein